MADRSYYFRDSKDDIVIAYKKYMKTIAQLFGANEGEAKTFVESTFNFEKKLAEVSFSDTIFTNYHTKCSGNF